MNALIDAPLNISLSEVVAVISLLMSMVALFKVFYSIGQTLATLQLKVDTMWDFTLRRAKSEAVAQGWATINSPLVFTEKAVAVIAPLMEPLRELYEKLGPISDTDLAIEIERLFGNQILNEICIPNHLYMGACLLIAIEAAKGKLDWTGKGKEPQSG